MRDTTATLKQLHTQDVEIAIVRIVDASPEKVFEAWLCPDHLSRWWGPRDGRRDWATPHAETDPKRGGAYRICIRSPQGDDYWAGGVYREIDKPRRLVFTYAWEKQDGHAGHDRIVTVDFSETTGKTRLAFHINGFSSIESRDSEIEGWSECLDRLVQYCASGQQHARDEADIRALATAWSRALEAKDLEGLMAGVGPDVLLFDCKPPYQINGVEGYRANWASCLPSFPAQMQSEHRDLSITVDGDVAFAHCLHHIAPIAEEHPCGQTWLRVTVCYRRIEGKWRVVHEHVSVPFDPMTERVSYITDLDVT
jgi:uncharacterized protein YndB with AHSA1/START domain/ketosteroid isomerase-like protein